MFQNTMSKNLRYFFTRFSIYFFNREKANNLYLLLIFWGLWFPKTLIIYGRWSVVKYCHCFLRTIPDTGSPFSHGKQQFVPISLTVRSSVSGSRWHFWMSYKCGMLLQLYLSYKFMSFNTTLLSVLIWISMSSEPLCSFLIFVTCTHTYVLAKETSFY